ncbi:MAG: hypothetical protein JXA54_12050 [Candidatus Heimdallarchaeota archaeon]|nr:hypothetical protein [Candidatus Heimdallarchaeota archaeon]
MKTRQSNELTISMNEITNLILKSSTAFIETNLNTDTIDDLLQKESYLIRKNPLYKGQLDYLKEVILLDFPNIDVNQIVEKLDVRPSVAKLLLTDCKKDCENLG